VDEWIRVSTATRSSPRGGSRVRRGILAGGSAGSTLWAAIRVAERLPADATCLAIIPDSGPLLHVEVLRRQLDARARLRRAAGSLPTVDELLHAKHGGEVPSSSTIAAHAKVGEGIDTMQRYGSPSCRSCGDGSASRSRRDRLAARSRACSSASSAIRTAVHEDVAAAMQPPLAAVEASATLDEVFATLSGRDERRRRRADGKPVGMLTRSGPARLPRAPAVASIAWPPARSAGSRMPRGASSAANAARRLR
jgi:cystathionine beta-synthase